MLIKAYIALNKDICYVSLRYRHIDLKAKQIWLTVANHMAEQNVNAKA